MVSIKQVQEVEQQIINESVELSNLVLLQAGYNKLISKLYELETKEKDCVVCRGRGYNVDWNKNAVKCSTCNGTGKIAV